MWISHKYTYVSCFFNLPPTPHLILLGGHRVPRWAPCIIWQIPSLLHVVMCMFHCYSLNLSHPLLCKLEVLVCCVDTMIQIFVIFSTVELEVVKNSQSGENSIMYPFSYYSWQLKVAQRKTIQRKENRTVKTRGNYHFTTCQNGYQEKFTNIKCWWGCREKRTLVHWWWECKLVQPFESNMQVPQKNKNRTTIWSTPGYTSRKKKRKRKH